MVTFLTEEQRDSILELYVAYFNRAPESAGLHYWSDFYIGQLNAGVDEDDILEDMANQFYDAGVYYSDLTGYTAAMTVEEFITVAYSNVLGRDEVDAEGMAYWTAKLESGEVSRGLFILTLIDEAKQFVIDNPTSPYAWVSAYLENRLEVAKWFSQISVSGGLTGEDAIIAGMEVLKNVTADPDSVDEVINGGVPMPVFNLTTGIDTGPTENDGANIINGTEATFTAFDDIDGGNGRDTLNLYLNGGLGSVPGFVDVDNVEIVNIYSAGSLGSDGGFDMSDWSGVTDITVDARGDDIVDITSAASDSVTIEADGDVMLEDESAQAIDIESGGEVGVTAGDADTIDIVASDDVTVTGGDVGTIDIATDNSSGWPDVDISVDSVGSVSVTGADDLAIAANDNTTLNLTIGDHDDHIAVGASNFADSGPTTLNLNVIDDVYLDFDDSRGSVSDSNLETINVAGSSDVYIYVTDLSDTLSLVDAGGYTGYVHLHADVQSDAALTVLTGTGSDDLYLWAGSDSTLTVDAGEGNNYVSVDAEERASINVTTGSGSDGVYVDGFESGDSDAAVTVDAGEGDNSVEAWTLGQTNVTVGDGDDFVLVTAPSMGMSDSSVALGAGENTLYLWYNEDLNATASDNEIDAFDVTFGGNITGSLSHLILDTELWMDSDTESTLDVSGLDGEVESITFGDVEMQGSSDSASLTITGTGPVLDLISWDDFGDFGDDEVINLNVVDVTTLSVWASDDISLNLEGDSNSDGTQDTMIGLTDITLQTSDDEDGDIYLDIAGFRNGATLTAIGDESVEVRVSDSDLGDITIAAEDDEAELHIDDNVGTSVSVGNVSITAGAFISDGWFWGSDAYMHIDDNDDSAIEVGNVTLLSWGSDAELEIENNDAGTAAAGITMGNVTITSYDSDAILDIDDNDDWVLDGDNVITLENVVVDAGEDAYVYIYDNDGTTLTLGTVDLIAGSDARLDIDNNDSDSDITLGAVTITASDDAYVNIDYNDYDALVSLFSLDITASDDAYVNIYNNDWGSGVILGAVNITAGGTADFDIYGNCDAEIQIGDVTMSGYWAELYVSDNAWGTDITLGNIDLTSSSDAWVYLNSNWDASDGTITTGDITITASDDVDLDMVGVSDAENITVTAGDDASLWLSDTPDVVSLTVAASDAIITLDYDLGSLRTIDLSGVVDGAIVNASDAAFADDATGVTIQIGNSDLSVYLGSDSDDGERQVYQFVGDDIGTIMISDFDPSQFGQDDDGAWSDRLDFSQFAGVDSLDDLIFTDTGDDVEIDFVDAGYGLITLMGAGAGTELNATDLVAGSIIF